MWPLQPAGALIARLTPDTPPAAWIPYAGYAAATAAALLVAFAVLRLSGSRPAAAAAAIAYVATRTMPGSGLGPLVVVLTVFGIFCALTSKPLPRLGPVALLLLLLGGAVLTDIGLLTWVFAGCGMAGVASAVHLTRWPRTAGAIAIGLLAVLAIAARVPAAETSEPPAPKSLGHDRVTLRSMRALVSNIPSGAALVIDDTNTGILMRAMARDLERAGVRVATIDSDAASVTQALKTGRVFALPHAQQALALQGFRIVDGARVADRGLAEVTSGADCITATHQWQDAPQLAGHSSLAFVARNDDERGPVVLFLSGREDFIRVTPVGWPARTLRGFSPGSFDMRSLEDRRAFIDASGGTDPVPNPSATGDMLTRVAMWRMPDASRLMRIDLSEPATLVSVVLAPEAKHPVTVCPAFPAPVFPIR